MPNGLTSFQALQNYSSSSAAVPGRLSFYAFDLLFLGGIDLRRRPLIERKQRLRELLAASPGGDIIQYVDHIVGDGPRVFEGARALGAEGIVCKRASSLYTGGRSRDWLKVKCVRNEEFVAGGFTEPEGVRSGLGALLVGYYDAAQRLRYAGSVGTGRGFTRAFLTELRRQLGTIEQTSSPFLALAPTQMRSRWSKGRNTQTHWVQPLLTIEVGYLERTDDGLLRHPTFVRFRP